MSESDIRPAWIEFSQKIDVQDGYNRFTVLANNGDPVVWANVHSEIEPKARTVDVNSDWLMVVRRLQSVAGKEGMALINMDVLVLGGLPVFWSTPNKNTPNWR